MPLPVINFSGFKIGWASTNQTTYLRFPTLASLDGTAETTEAPVKFVFLSAFYASLIISHFLMSLCSSDPHNGTSSSQMRGVHDGKESSVNAHPLVGTSYSQRRGVHDGKGSSTSAGPLVGTSSSEISGIHEVSPELELSSLSGSTPNDTESSEVMSYLLRSSPIPIDGPQEMVTLPNSNGTASSTARTQRSLDISSQHKSPKLETPAHKVYETRSRPCPRRYIRIGTLVFIVVLFTLNSVLIPQPPRISVPVLASRNVNRLGIAVRWFTLCYDEPITVPPAISEPPQMHDLFVHIARTNAQRDLDQDVTVLFQHLKLWVFNEAGCWETIRFDERRRLGGQDLALTINVRFEPSWVKPSTMFKDKRFKRIQECE
ncbi:hypothetical protein VKT23_020029 [Stygiomarasmius scandens]|uniref:Uncharacterized protein n=1 Tax=Marasmiellus scandens TaxID=2682957 RepID=A0ABR1IJZ9_9AGAR